MALLSAPVITLSNESHFHLHTVSSLYKSVSHWCRGPYKVVAPLKEQEPLPVVIPANWSQNSIFMEWRVVKNLVFIFTDYSYHESNVAKETIHSLCFLVLIYYAEREVRQASHATGATLYLFQTPIGDSLLMESSGVAPDVVDVVPPTLVQVSYGSGVTVNEGNELTPTQVKDVPTNVSWPTEPGVFYTLCMTDPDAPTRAEPTLREVKHWLVVNIPGTDIGKGTTIAEYRGSGPPQGSGMHRYVFLVYRQSDQLDVGGEVFSSRSMRKGRLQFRIRDFAVKYGLGQPIAGNFYQAQFDDYVPILHAQLSHDQ